MARAAPVPEIDVTPEPDRLDGFPHPRETVRLFGHEPAERAFAEAFHSGRMHHGWVVAGPQGIGKATLVYRLARFVLAGEEERDLLGASLTIAEDSTAFRQVRALSHPGLLVMRRPYDAKAKRLKSEITVDEVRRLRSFLSHTGAENAWRVVVVDTADELNANAANGLLKSLEEPPPRTLFLLVSTAPGRLLATIRSRCRLLALSPLASGPLKDAVRQAVAASNGEAEDSLCDEAQWERLERLSGGSVRRLLSLRATRGAELLDRLLKLVDGLPKLDWGAVHALGDELGASAAEERFELLFELLMDHLARLIASRATKSGTDAERAQAVRLIGDGRLAGWAELWERVAADKADALALNLDRKALILETFSRLEAAARR